MVQRVPATRTGSGRGAAAGDRSDRTGQIEGELVGLGDLATDQQAPTIRYERKADIHLAFTLLAASLILWTYVQRWFIRGSKLISS